MFFFASTKGLLYVLGYISNIIPPLSENPQLNDTATTVNQKNNQHNDNRREILEGFGLSGYGMEFLSVAAGVTAKDKRLKDVRNQAAVLKDKEMFPKFTSKKKVLIYIYICF